MSHLVSMDLKIKDIEAAKAACNRLGWTFLENQKTYETFGSWVDDSPVPEQLFSPEEYAKVVAMDRKDRKKYMKEVMGRCDHAIKVPGASYEVGLVKKGDEYIPVFDWFGSGGLRHLKEEPGMAGFLQAYALECAKRQARKEGKIIGKEVALADGWKELTVQEY